MKEIPNLFRISLETVKEVSSFLRKASGAFPRLESRASHRELKSQPIVPAGSLPNTPEPETDGEGKRKLGRAGTGYLNGYPLSF